jgi:poly-gamma-glutamate synthesis protein (capsule biosynthesis protein)
VVLIRFWRFVLVGSLLTSGCGPAPRDATWTTAVTPSPSASPTPTEITLAFAGDVHFAGRTLALLDEPATSFGPIADTLAAADLTVVNLETAVTDRGVPEPKTFHFRAPASTYDAVKAAGVDLVTLANNHALDYGQEGLADTVEHARRAGVPTVGAGADAYAPWITEVRGTRFAFLGFSQVSELWERWRATETKPGIAMSYDRRRALKAVREAVAATDVVIVYVHWGREGDNCPTEEMGDFAGALADAGAKIVVGTHAHLMLGDGWLGKTYVHYGLGNFLWWRDDAFSNDTGVLRVTVRDHQVTHTDFLPATISRTTGQPVPTTSARSTSNLRGCTDLTGHPGP